MVVRLNPDLFAQTALQCESKAFMKSNGCGVFCDDLTTEFVNLQFFKGKSKGAMSQ
jgi:hypothetical protein